MPEWALQVVGIVASAAAVYAGIRADLASIRVKAEAAAEAAKDAHRRIDSILERGKTWQKD
jgi:hypothetical protein